MPQRVIDRINAMGLHDKQPEDIIIRDRNDQQTVNDFNLGLDENEENDDDGTDASFDPVNDKDTEQAGDHEVEDYAEDETQLDYYPNNDDNELSSENEEVGVREDNEDSDTDDDNNNDPMLEELNEIDNNNNDDDSDNNVTDDESDDEYMVEDIDESENDDNDEDNSNNDNSDNNNNVTAPRGLDSTLDGPHWDNCVHTQYCMSVISGYGNLEATLSTPQYGF
jgi:hypothetical protein